MQTLIMMDVKNGKKIKYQLKDIKEIVTDKAKNFFNKNDLENNNIKPNTVITIIYFKDGEYYKEGEQASFEAINWKMLFE